MQFSLWWLLLGVLCTVFAQDEYVEEQEIDESYEEMSEEDLYHAQELYRQKMEIRQKISSLKSRSNPYGDMPMSSPQILTTSYMVDYHDLKLPIGKSLTILCHFHNFGANTPQNADDNRMEEPPRSFNITAVVGTLNVITDFAYTVQNFTFKLIPTASPTTPDRLPVPLTGLVVHPHEEATIDYQFTISPFTDTLSGHQFSMSHIIFYTDLSTGSAHATPFFNQTIDLYTDDDDDEFHQTLRYAERQHQKGLAFMRPVSANELKMTDDDAGSDFWELIRRSRIGRRKLFGTRTSIADMLQTIIGLVMTVSVGFGLKFVLFGSSEKNAKSTSSSSSSSSSLSRLAIWKESIESVMHEISLYFSDMWRMLKTGTITATSHSMSSKKLKKKRKEEKKNGEVVKPESDSAAHSS